MAGGGRTAALDLLKTLLVAGMSWYSLRDRLGV